MKPSPVIALSDQFGPHFIGHDWPTVIAALAISLEAAMHCYAKQAGVPIPSDVLEFLRDISAIAVEGATQMAES